MKKNWKQFWTLNRHHAEGFTLVELIVVIAILAILSAVAIPAYSGYINKTHMTTDQKLVSEVADALTLFFYANPNKGSAYVVLTPDGTQVDAEGNGDEAMTAVFGAGYATNTKLSYKKWSETDNGMVNAASGLSDEARASALLQGSNTATLLGNVSALTNAFSGLAENVNDDVLYGALLGFAGGDDEAFEELCGNYHIDIEEVGGTKKINATDTQISNLVVAAVANNYNNNTQENRSEVTNLVTMYALYSAAAATDPSAQSAYNTLNASLQSARNPADVQNALDTFAASGALDNYTTEATDMAAIDALMATIGNAELSADDMNDANLFSTGKGAQYFNTYVSAAQILNGLSIPENGIAVILNADSGTPEIFCSNDAAYLQGK